MPDLNIKTQQIQNDLKGLNQLSRDGVVGVVDLVEAMHQRIYSLGGLINDKNSDKTSGITRFIYQTIRKTTELSTRGIGFAIDKLSPILSEFRDDKKRNLWISILNGVMGDHLAATGNPLAMDMTWHYQGQAVSPQQAAIHCAQQPGQPLILIHGLCMNDHLWKRKDHDHGAALKDTNQVTPIYVRYNSGLAIYQNGLKLAEMMNSFIQNLPADKKPDVLCHSMGGLVMRSALQVTKEISHSWHQEIRRLVFLGTPHQGAVLEKTGNLIDYLININPYSAPFTKLGKIRSHGIKNLRHGTVTQDHQTIQLPEHIESYTIAASTKDNGHHLHLKWIGDGLVSVKSALGEHVQPEREIIFKEENKHTIENESHFGLLSNKKVYQLLQKVFVNSK